MATLQKAIKVGSSIAAVLPKALLRESGIVAGSPIFVEIVEGGILVRLAKPEALSPREKKVLSMTDAFINRYRADLDRLKDA